ncbi:YbjN domain-containing protein [Alloalcanivorax profundimaris]|uniref:YbjN domain-containing protein n=1 Tax=Alloalcanivorax profundimaris TaxID=2735259 RepID=UPI0018888240|nr:YbjN domain-containing protein [Alloalcanivorax profundimaris]MBF1801690.1 YbjN domain-containing protein [Alloalcanivorax profundimaris]
MSDATPIIDSVTLGDLAELLREAGYRTNESEQNGLRQLLSASQGVGFAVRPGNPQVEDAERLLDFTLSCALRIDGVLPEGMVATWNRSKRFGRLGQQGDFLVLEMDVLVAGGVSRGHLRTSVELWDRLMRELLLYLRNYRAPEQDAEAGEPAAS